MAAYRIKVLFCPSDKIEYRFLSFGKIFTHKRVRVQFYCPQVFFDFRYIFTHRRSKNIADVMRHVYAD